MASNMRKLLAVAVAALCSVVLSSCVFSSGPLDGIYEYDEEQADARMAQIAAAVESRDADALEALFSTRAVVQAPAFEEGLEYFLSSFPNGGLTWQREHYNASWSSEYGTIELLSPVYKVTAGGNDYRLAFADFTADDANPENVGLYGLGMIPWTDDMDSREVAGLYSYIGSVGLDEIGEYGYSGIYIPDDSLVYKGEMGDARMGQIAAAVDGPDAAALSALFSARALEQATAFDVGVADFLSYFPDGELAWERRVVNSDSEFAGEGAKLLTAQYKVSAGGEDYRLFFADFAVDATDPENVGLAALAVTPWTEPGDPSLDPAFDSWNSS